MLVSHKHTENKNGFNTTMTSIIDHSKLIEQQIKHRMKQREENRTNETKSITTQVGPKMRLIATGTIKQ
jgi:hypothetical protein